MGKKTVYQAGGNFVLGIFAFLPFYAFAELQALDDEGLSEVSAQQGVGIILSDVGLYADENANVQLSFDTDLGGEDSAYFDHVSIYGSDSNSTCDANPSIVSCSGIDIGSFSDPITLNIVSDDTNNISYIELDWVDSASGNDSGIDIQTRFTTVTPGTGLGVNKPSGGSRNFKIDTSWLHIQNFTMADSDARIWSSGPISSFDVNSNGTISTNQINGGSDIGFAWTANLNVSFDLSADVGSNLGTSFFGSGSTGRTDEFSKLPPFSEDDRSRSRANVLGNDQDDEGLLVLTNVEISNLSLGHYPYLPARFGSIDRDGTCPGAGSVCAPDFFIEVPIVPNNSTIYSSVYASDKADITIEQIRLGNDSGGTPFFLGTSSAQPAASITGVRIQHLRLETNG